MGVGDLKALVDSLTDKPVTVLLTHGNGEGSPVMIDSVIAVCDEILNGTADNVPFESPLGRGLIAKTMGFQHFCRADGGVGNVVYDPGKLN